MYEQIKKSQIKAGESQVQAWEKHGRTHQCSLVCISSMEGQCDAGVCLHRVAIHAGSDVEETQATASILDTSTIRKEG